MHFKILMVKMIMYNFFVGNSPYDNVCFIYHIRDEKKRLQFNIFKTKKQKPLKKKYKICVLLGIFVTEKKIYTLFSFA